MGHSTKWLGALRLKELHEAAVSILVEVELVQGLELDFNVPVGDEKSRYVW